MRFGANEIFARIFHSRREGRWGEGEEGFAVTSINMVIVAGVKFSKSKFHDNRNETANNGAKDGA